MSIPSQDIFDIGQRIQKTWPSHVVMLTIRHKGIKHDQIKFHYHPNIQDAISHIKNEQGIPLVNDSDLSILFHNKSNRADYTTIIFFDKNKFNTIKNYLEPYKTKISGDYFTNLFSNLFPKTSSPPRSPKSSLRYSSPLRTSTGLPPIPDEDVLPPLSSSFRDIPLPENKLPPPPPPSFPTPLPPIIGSESGPSRSSRQSSSYRRSPRLSVASSPRSLAMTPLPQVQIGSPRRNNGGGMYNSEFDRGCGCGGGLNDKSNNGGNGGDNGQLGQFSNSSKRKY